VRTRARKHRKTIVNAKKEMSCIARPARNIWGVWVRQKRGRGSMWKCAHGSRYAILSSHCPCCPISIWNLPPPADDISAPYSRRYKQAYLYEKCRDIGRDEQARDEARLYEEVLVHIQMSRQASEEDVVGRDECARLAPHVSISTY
jgi:hypothetical protein